MGRRVYLTDNEVRVLNEALSKWHNWVSNAWDTEDEIQQWEQDAYANLNHKLYEGNMIKP